MSRTFVRQDTQIRNSDLYDDTLSVGATLETQTTIEGDLNALRSQAKRALYADVAGDWYADINIPSTLETGTKRGIRALNDALHLIEKKRILRQVHKLTDIAVPAAAAAVGTLTSTGAISDGETVTIGAQTYTFRSPFVNASGNIDASGTTAQALENLRRAINGDGVAGTNYGTGTPVNTQVTAVESPTTVVVTAILSGTAGNVIATTETGANLSWGGATLSGGAGDVKVLAAGELPANTTASVGITNTLGTIVASHGGTFGTHALSEVAGSNALSPDNLMLIVDGSTRDEILSGGRIVYGLLQGESGVVDGATITDTTTTRAQISFVRQNSTGDDLEAVPAADIGGKTINYATREQVRLEDLTRRDFLSGAVVDAPSSAVVTRQVAYDNQGTTPVNLLTNATLDLEGAGLVWAIRDDLEANLFRVVEGSAGGTSEVHLGTDVDTFNVDAVVNDFRTGVRVNTAGTRPIRVGSTDGVIETTAGDLGLTAFAEFAFVDGNKAGSTYSGQLKLSDTSAEWDAYETAFGEVSLLSAIVQAKKKENRTKGVAVVTNAIPADTNVENPTNIDAVLPAYDHVASFVDDVDVYVNGVLQRNGADASANHDVYPGTTPASGHLKFEYALKAGGSPDVITMVVWGEP
jgi:hypothetical protein